MSCLNPSASQPLSSVESVRCERVLLRAGAGLVPATSRRGVGRLVPPSVEGNQSLGDICCTASCQEQRERWKKRGENPRQVDNSGAFQARVALHKKECEPCAGTVRQAASSELFPATHKWCEANNVPLIPPPRPPAYLPVGKHCSVDPVQSAEDHSPRHALKYLVLLTLSSQDAIKPEFIVFFLVIDVSGAQHTVCSGEVGRSPLPRKGRASKRDVESTQIN
jgi:hypothetical protein